MELTGRKLGEYEVMERLGRGGMAMVYKGYQPGVQEMVAIKVLHRHLAADDDFVERFEREARLAGQLSHPHLVRLIDSDQEGDHYYMVMDYVPGSTLEEYLKTHAPLAPATALRIMTQLLDALGYAHKLDMIHRDIKPANIMFMDEEATHTVLTDFGLARILGEDGMTVTGQMIGTPAYMSLEAVHGEKVDKRTDIYSLGVVLYEMLCGRTPYIAKTPYTMILQQLHDPLPSIQEFNPTVPKVVEDLIMKALAKEPAERYQSAEKFQAAIKETLAMLNGGQVISSAPRLIRPAPPHHQRHPSTDKQATEAASKKQNNLLPLMLAAAGVFIVALIVVGLLSALG